MKFAGLQMWGAIVGAGAVFMMALTATNGFAQATESKLPPGVIAEQGGAQVSLKDIDAFAARMPEADRAGFFDSPKRIQGVITNMLLDRQLAAAARAAKLDQDPGVQRQIELATNETLARVDIAHYRDTLKKPSFGELAHEYFLSHKNEFLVPGKVQVKHVLVSNKDRSDDEAKARIGEVEAAAQAHPDQFDALVKKYSDDPSAKDNHGLIDDAASGKMVAPFAKAAKALTKPDQISPVVKTKFGYHVLKLVKRDPDTQKSFDEVRDGLVAKLHKEWIDTQVNEYTGQMRGKPLDANPDLVASLRTRYLAPGVILPEQAAREAREKAAAVKKDK
ncbi:MAG TPA: peptidylprolyl isomerase [Rudaea sp.]|nr:peptidylprolyl isomerase [Rudaea sp.]